MPLVTKAADERLNQLNFQMAKLKVWHGYGNCRTDLASDIKAGGIGVKLNVEN